MKMRDDKDHNERLDDFQRLYAAALWKSTGYR